MSHPTQAFCHPLEDDEIAAIRAVLRRLTAHRIANPEDAEDLVQETLLTLVAKSPENGLEKGLLAWSLGVLRNKVGNYYRRARRRSCIAAQPPGGAPGQGRNAHSPESKLIERELECIIQETLSRLSERLRPAMELWVRGLGPREIAERLHPERYQNVINRLHRGRMRLARELARYGYGRAGKTGRRRCC